MSTSNLTITVTSLPDYENLVAEMYVGEAFLGLVSEEEQGKRVFEGAEGLKVGSAVLIEALQAAEARLNKMDEPPAPR